MNLTPTARQQRQLLSILLMSLRLLFTPAEEPVRREAMDDATAPPPGLYYLGYFLKYRAHDIRLPLANASAPGSNKAESTVIVNRLLWITEHQLLGADYGMEILAPVARNSLQMSAYGLDLQDSGGADIYVSPLILGWHTPRWDVSAGAGMWLGQARSGSSVAPGSGYQSAVLSAGATYYLDESRTWTAAALFHYQRNGRTDHGWRFGDQIGAEWSAGKRWGLLQAGVVGYSRWQISRDTGPGTLDAHAQSHALGMQASYIFLPAKMMLRAAYYKEFGVQAATLASPQGSLLRLTLIKAF